MTRLREARRYAIAKLHWLRKMDLGQTVRATCYRADVGRDDIFSIFVRFERQASEGSWEEAKIFPVAEEMYDRLPAVGGRLVVTEGMTPVAFADVISIGDEVV